MRARVARVSGKALAPLLLLVARPWEEFLASYTKEPKRRQPSGIVDPPDMRPTLCFYCVLVAPVIYYVGRGKSLVECFINVPQANTATAMQPKLEGELTRKHSTKPCARPDTPT